MVKSHALQLEYKNRCQQYSERAMHIARAMVCYLGTDRKVAEEMIRDLAEATIHVKERMTR